MTTIALNLPDDLADRLRSQVAAEPGASLESYILALIAADQQRREKQEVEEKLIAGLQSPEVPLDQDFWAFVREEAEGLRPTERLAQ